MDIEIRSLEKQHIELRTELETLTGKSDFSADDATRCKELEGKLDVLGDQIKSRSRAKGYSKVSEWLDSSKSTFTPVIDERLERSAERDFNLLGAIRDMADGKLTGFAAEYTQEMRSKGQTIRGCAIPEGYRLRANELTTTAGTGAVPNVIVPTLVDYLRANTLVDKLGIQKMSINTPFFLPREKNIATIAGKNEAEAATISAADIEPVNFTPKRIAGFCSVTREMVSQSAIGVEGYIARKLSRDTEVKVSSLVFNGDAVKEPAGLLTDTSIPTLDFSAYSNQPTYQALLKLNETLNAANVPAGGPRAAVCGPHLEAYMKGLAKIGSYPVFVLEDGKIDGWPLYQSTLIPENLTASPSLTGLSAIVFGDWSYGVLNYFTGVDLVVDVYSQAEFGLIRLIINQNIGWGITQPNAFLKVLNCKHVA
jgi:HK97 family phage major capsid protein